VAGQATCMFASTRGITTFRHAHARTSYSPRGFDAPAKVWLLSVTTPAVRGQESVHSYSHSVIRVHGLGIKICMFTANTPPHGNGINLLSHDLVHLRISATKIRCLSRSPSGIHNHRELCVFKSVRTKLFVCMTKAYTTYMGGNRMA
jgi:hypothetical protein